MDRVNLWVCDSVYHHFNFSTECPFSNHLSPFQFLDLKVHFFISLLTSSGMKDPCQDFVCGGFWETFLVFILFFYLPSFLGCQIFGVGFIFLLGISLSPILVSLCGFFKRSMSGFCLRFHPLGLWEDFLRICGAHHWILMQLLPPRLDQVKCKYQQINNWTSIDKFNPISAYWKLPLSGRSYADWWLWGHTDVTLAWEDTYWMSRRRADLTQEKRSPKQPKFSKTPQKMPKTSKIAENASSFKTHPKLPKTAQQISKESKLVPKSQNYC